MTPAERAAGELTQYFRGQKRDSSPAPLNNLETLALERWTSACPECERPLPSVYYLPDAVDEQTPPWLLVCAACFKEMREALTGVAWPFLGPKA